MSEFAVGEVAIIVGLRGWCAPMSGEEVVITHLPIFVESTCQLEYGIDSPKLRQLEPRAAAFSAPAWCLRKRRHPPDWARLAYGELVCNPREQA
jgi:hypothetical protein